MRKRILSILLCLVMVMGLFPTMAFAADGSGATTGSGTASDPIVVTTFDELKAELEKDTLGTSMYYIKVPKGVDIEKGLKPETYSAGCIVRRQKTLIVDGTVTVTAIGNEVGVRSMFIVNGSETSLDIRGSGTLTFKANTNASSNAVVDVDNGGTLNVSGGVTLSGTFNTSVYGMAVYNYGGTVNIDNATLTGETGGISYGGAVYADGGTTNIKNATLKSSVFPKANAIKENNSGTIYVGKDATLTIENSIIHTTDGVTDGHSIYPGLGNTKHISEYLGANQKIYKLSDNTQLNKNVSSLTDSVNITENISEEINTVSLTISRSMLNTISDFEHISYAPYNRMKLGGCTVYKGLYTASSSNEIEDKDTSYDPHQDYTAMYYFEARPNYSFTDEALSQVSVSGGVFWKADTMGSSNRLRVFVNFPAASAAGQVVKKVDIKVKPEAQRTKLEDFNCQSYTPAGGMGNPARFLREGLNTDGSGSAPTAYDKNQDYSVVYQFPINPGYTIAEGISKADVTINDGQVWKVSSDSDGKNLLVYVNFPAASTAGQVVKTVTIQVTPKAERTKLEDFDCQSYTPAGGMGNPARFLREGLNTDGSGSAPTAYDKNQDYSVVYQFPINPGYTIAEGISKADVTINDGQVWKVSSDSDGKNLLVYVNFPAKAAEDPNYVTEAAVQIAAPVAGEKPKGTVDIPVLGDNKDKVKKAMMWWSGMLSGNTAFVAGQEYTAIVYLEPKEGVTFADDMKLNVNGKVVDLLSKDYDGSVQFKVKFTAVDTVTEAAVQVAAPVAGEKPKGTVDIPVLGDNKDKVKKAMMWWSGMLSGNTAFVAGQEYTAIVYLEPKEGVTFADDMKLNVNGKVVDLLSKDYDGSVQFKVMFTATGSTHTHSYGTDWKYDDTNHWHECQCGDKADTAAHSFQWVIDKAATKEAAGIKHEECTVCGAKRSENTEIPALQDYAVTVTGGTATVAAGTPITRAIEGVEVTVTAQAPDGTHFVKWVVKAGGITLANETSATTTFIMPANDVTIEAEFAENPVEAYTLTVIKGTASVAAGTPITDKIEQNTVVTVTADAPEAGKVFDKWVVLEGNVTLADAAKATTTFTMPANDVKLEATYKDATPSHTHSYGKDWKYDDTNHWHECQCGDKADVAAHSASEWIIDTAATETTDGAKHKECTVCKKVLETATIPAAGSTHTHSYGTDWMYDGTNHWHECKCGDKADIAAHSASEWIVDTAATETADGAKHKECTACKKVLETATIPATGSTHTHSYGTDWKYDDTNHWHECECGDKADVAAHSFQWVIDKAATKEATGIKHEECTVCGAKRSENTVIDKLPDGGNTGNTGTGDNNTDKPGKDDSTKSPQTGDSISLIGWLAALFVSGGVLTVLGLNGKKRKESDAE